MGASPRLRSLLLLNVLHYHHSFYSPLLEARYPDQTFAPIHLLGLGWGDCFPSAIIAFDQSSIGSQMEDYLIYDHRLFLGRCTSLYSLFLYASSGFAGNPDPIFCEISALAIKFID